LNEKGITATITLESESAKSEFCSKLRTVCYIEGLAGNWYISSHTLKYDHLFAGEEGCGVV
jgi:hypothetical protein